MVYKGSMMNYTVKDTQTFTVRNNKPQKTTALVKQDSEESKEPAEYSGQPMEIELARAPTMKIEY